MLQTLSNPTLSAPALPVPARQEELHPNVVAISGTITRAYRQDDDVVVRLKSETYGQTHHVSLLLPGGQPASGQAVSLLTGARLLARGYLRSVERVETYADLLKRIGHPKRIEDGDENIRIARTVTYVVADSLALAPEGEPDVNEVEVQGIVWKTWKLPRQSHVYARLAIYDAYAPLRPNGNGRAKREAHYASIMFPQGVTVEGIPVNMTPHKQKRCSYRVIGYLHNMDYFERLSRLLKRVKQPDRIREGDEDIKVGRTTTYVVGRQLHEYLAPIRVENGRSRR